MGVLLYIRFSAAYWTVIWEHDVMNSWEWLERNETFILGRVWRIWDEDMQGISVSMYRICIVSQDLGKYGISMTLSGAMWHRVGILYLGCM